MRAAYIYYPLTSLGPGNRIGFWTKGCSKNCYNCMSKFLQEYDENSNITIDKIKEDIIRINTENVTKITISGGEPFDNDDFYDFLLTLRGLGFNDILVYTGYTLDELKSKNFDNILRLIDVLIDGPYIDALNNNSTLKGSDNQTINIFNSNLIQEYEEYLKKGREINYKILDDDKLLVFGIPKK